MAYDVLDVVIDGAEPRITKDRIATVVTGGIDGRLQWDVDNSDETWVDPITFTGILYPIPLTPPWATTTTGDYYRLHKADYDVAASDSWKEHSLGIDGNVYLYGLGTNDPVTTLATWPKNQPFWLSFYPFGAGDNFPQCVFEFGGLGLQFYSDGTVLVYKAFTLEGSGLLVGKGNLCQLEGQHSAFRQQRGGQASNNLQGQLTDVLIMPWRNRDLLVLSNRGGGFNFTFDDIDKDEPDPTISAAGVARWLVPTAQPMVQLAPVRFKTAGTLLSFPQTFFDAPDAGASASAFTYWGHGHYDTPPTASAALLDTDGTTPFVGNGTKQSCLLKVTLAGNGKITPFIYGAQAEFDPVTEDTDATEAFSLMDYLTEIRLDVPDEAWGETLTLVAKEVIDLETHVAGARRQSNRPILAAIGSVPIFFGRTGEPSWKDEHNDRNTELTWKCTGMGRALETYQLRYPVPFDTMQLADALAYLATAPGFPDAAMDIEDYGVALDSPGQASNGEWCLLPEAGDSARQWVDKLTELFSQNSIVGWYPSITGTRFRHRSIPDLGDAPVTTLYATMEEAKAAGFTDPDEITAHVYSNFQELSPEVESNFLTVVGWDNRLERALYGFVEDVPGETVTTKPSDRPDNWVGERRPVSNFNPAITTQALVNYALGVMRARLFAQHRPAEWESQFQFQDGDGSAVWRGNVVRLSQHGLYRVRSLSGVFDVESPTRVRRPFHYTGEFIPE